MAVFEYKAINATGRSTKGIVDAENVRAARLKLKKQGIFPTEVRETASEELISASKDVTAFFKDRKVNATHLALATRQLATLVGAGIPLVEALRALGEQLDQPRLKAVFAEVCDRVNEGSTLADAMRDYPKVFPRLFSNMVASGEMSGTLDRVLERLADFLENQSALKRKVTAALTYPALMMFLCFAVVVLLLVYVVPQLTKIFEDNKAILPLPTRIVVALSNFFTSYWLLIFALILFSVFGFIRYAKTELGRKKIDGLKLRLPLFGPMATKIATARLARTLGTMLSSGIELLTALSITRNIIGNVVLEAVIDQAREGVREGRSLAAELNKPGIFPRMLIHMIAIGEKTGQLEPMLHRAASNYELEVNTVISSLTSVLEPLLILFLAVVVGGIVMSVMLPLVEMTSLGG